MSSESGGKEKFLIVGSGGRESAIAVALAKTAAVYAVIDHENPTIVACVQASGGGYIVHNINDAKRIAAFAAERHIDYALVSADAPLAHGVVDALIERGIRAVGGSREASRIEWDKIYSIEMVNRVCPTFTPEYRVAATPEELRQGLDYFKDKNLLVAVKPQGLTGGKGVKVMPEHLKDYEACMAYGLQLLERRPTERILLVERLYGMEFTIMGFTDGKTLILAPATYDYPFRFEGDEGPGTGGMGCFTSSSVKLPFMTDKDLSDCRLVMQRIIDEMWRRNLAFNGVLNGGFFKTAAGVKFMEFNSRLGDPEGINVLSLLQSPLTDVVRSLWHGVLASQPLQFAPKASVVKYLVAREYPGPSPSTLAFRLDGAELKARGIDIYASACVCRASGEYETLGKSRALALCVISSTVEEGSERINEAIKNCFSGALEYRADVGSAESLKKLAKQEPK